MVHRGRQGQLGGSKQHGLAHDWVPIAKAPGGMSVEAEGSILSGSAMGLTVACSRVRGGSPTACQTDVWQLRELANGGTQKLDVHS
jgi:hypothetical protein